MRSMCISGLLVSLRARTRRP